MNDPGADRHSRRVRLAGDLALVACAAIVAAERMTRLRWDSDDVSRQVAWKTWDPGGSTLYLTENTYWLRSPVVALADWALPHRPGQLFLLATLFNAFALLLVARWVRYSIEWRLGTRTPATLEPLIVAATVVPAVLTATTRGNLAGVWTRNLEIGLVAVAVVGCCELWRRREHRSTSVEVAVGLVGAVVVGLLSLNDPMFAYSVVAPATVVLGVVAALRRDRTATVLALAGAGGFVVWRLLRRLTIELGVDLISAGVEPTPADALEHLSRAIDVLTMSLGLQPDDAVSGVARVLAFAGGVLVLPLVCRAVIGWRVLPVPAAVGLVWFTVVLALFVGTSAADLGADRYLTFGLAGLSPAVAIGAIGLPRPRRIGAALLVLGVGAALTAQVAAVRDRPEVVEIAVTREIERAVGDEPVQVYAGYWMAPMTGFYSDARWVSASVACDARAVNPFRWLADSTPFDRDARDVGAVIVLEPNRDDVGSLRPCEPADLRAQFGEPDRIVEIPPRSLWIYDRDIVTDLAGRE